MTSSLSTFFRSLMSISEHLKQSGRCFQVKMSDIGFIAFFTVLIVNAGGNSLE